MYKKFGTVYFAAHKDQILGPQARAHEWADANKNTFFVMFESGLSPDGKKSYYEFASYKNLSTFLDEYNQLAGRQKCFFEQIREGHPCCEYYDIDWNLPLGDTDLVVSNEISPPALNMDIDAIAFLEKQVFAEFLTARNQYAPNYPVSPEDCRISTSSTQKKISLHINVPTYTFENNHVHIRTFLIGFFDKIEAAQDKSGSGLLKYIDSGVYSRNRSMRCLGSSKRRDLSRSLNRAEWHQSSKNAPDSEFYITNIHPDAIGVANDGISVNKPAHHVIRQSNNAPTTKDSHVNAGAQVSLPKSIVDATFSLFVGFEQDAVKKKLIKSEHIGQYKVQYNNGMDFKLQRNHAGHCIVCMREHTSENAFLRLNETTSEVFQHCYRSLDKPGMSIGKLSFESLLDVMTAIASQSPSNVFHADIKYCNETILSKDGDETPVDKFLAPPREPLQFSNGKFEIITRHPPSIMLKGETGLGKTFFMERMVEANKGCKFITVSCKRTLSNAHEHRLRGFSNYQDLPTGLIACDKIAIQAESLHRLQLDYYNEDVILFLDETSSLFSQMTSHVTMGDKIGINNKILCSLIKGATRVVCLDADLTNEDVQIIKNLRNDVVVIHNEYKPQKGDRVVIADKTNAMHEELLKMRFKGKCITGDSGEEEKRHISQYINEVMWDLDYFIHTPTICVGIDYCNIKCKFDYVAGFFSTQSKVNVETSRQMLRRARHVTSKTYLIYTDKTTSDLPTMEDDIKRWICNQENIVDGKVHNLPGLEFEAEYGKGLRLVDGFYSQVYICTYIKNNLSRNGFMKRFIEQMLHAGCTIQSAQGDSAEGVQFLRLQKETQEKIVWERCERIAKARRLTQEEFDKICDIENLNPDDKYAVVRYRLMTAYDLSPSEAITPEWVKKYNDKWEKSVYKNLSTLNRGIGVDMQIRLDEIHQQEKLSYQYYRETGQDAKALDAITRSRYIRLKYVVDILNPCGFTSILPSNIVSAERLRIGIETIWDGLVKDIPNMCTTLNKRRPTTKIWKFRYKLDFLNSVLNEVLGVKIVSSDSRRTKYYLNHYSKVGKDMLAPGSKT
ncbi:hypothetical protein BGZ49_002671 [Haplosporangium sp. Z 27]|nr:hypothetical protein BGZ49_002671 [Haplosporangium sp. Z 27]